MKKQTGFTLIELLITISIIAILSVVLSISFSNAQRNGRDQRRISDLKAIQNAAEQYYMLNNGAYPASSDFVVGRKWAIGAQSVLERYPVDPKNTAPYVYNIYTHPNMPYCVCARMENPTKNSNAGNLQCSFVNETYFFCVKNQQ